MLAGVGTTPIRATPSSTEPVTSTASAEPLSSPIQSVTFSVAVS